MKPIEETHPSVEYICKSKDYAKKFISQSWKKEEDVLWSLSVEQVQKHTIDKAVLKEVLSKDYEIPIDINKWNSTKKEFSIHVERKLKKLIMKELELEEEDGR